MTAVFSIPAPADWTTDAACAKSDDPDLFYPETKGPHRAARAVCQACPVRVQCLEAGMDERHGVWGGTSPQERQELRRRRGNRPARVWADTADHGTEAGARRHYRRGEKPCQSCLTASRTAKQARLGRVIR